MFYLLEDKIYIVVIPYGLGNERQVTSLFCMTTQGVEMGLTCHDDLVFFTILLAIQVNPYLAWSISLLHSITQLVYAWF